MGERQRAGSAGAPKGSASVFASTPVSPGGGGAKPFDSAFASARRGGAGDDAGPLASAFGGSPGAPIVRRPGFFVFPLLLGLLLGVLVKHTSSLKRSTTHGRAFLEFPISGFPEGTLISILARWPRPIVRRCPLKSAPSAVAL